MLKKMFGYERCDSMTGVYLDLLLPTLDTVVHNSCVFWQISVFARCTMVSTIHVY